MESAVVTQTSQESGGETQSTSGATRARIHITAERTRQAGKGKQTNFKRLKKWKATPNTPPPVLFSATTFQGKSVEITEDEFKVVCKWPMNQWTHLNKLEFLPGK